MATGRRKTLKGVGLACEKVSDERLLIDSWSGVALPEEKLHLGEQASRHARSRKRRYQGRC
jgi:hypothetical protein